MAYTIIKGKVHDYDGMMGPVAFEPSQEDWVQYKLALARTSVLAKAKLNSEVEAALSRDKPNLEPYDHFPTLAELRAKAPEEIKAKHRRYLQEVKSNGDI